MKISMYLPKGTNKDKTNGFIQSELSTARNIQSSQTKNSVITNLNKIASSI